MLFLILPMQRDVCMNIRTFHIDIGHTLVRYPTRTLHSTSNRLIQDNIQIL